MTPGDLVRITYTTTLESDRYNSEESKIAMIIEGPNEAGKIKLLLSNGKAFWKHTSEVEYMPKDKRYLHD
jgi:hypothetical protein